MQALSDNRVTTFDSVTADDRPDIISHHDAGDGQILGMGTTRMTWQSIVKMSPS